jgi:ABC transport system ATP-binding/permease protein
MPLLSIKDISIMYGSVPLLDGASMVIEAGERIGLLGRNGSGKSTLMKIVAGLIVPDAGEISKATGSRVAYLPQEVPDNVPGTIYEVVASGGFQDIGLLKEYHDLGRQIGKSGDESLLRRLEQVQHEIETTGGWGYYQRVETVLSRIGLNEEDQFSSLSAGMKRSVYLARALVNKPDLLLLDEPTNHLDIPRILWLEEFLLKFEGTLLFVTHDRAFLKRLATRIAEIDRGRLLSFECTYDKYLERRAAFEEEEERQNREFDKKLAREEVWIRRGIRARRTRNEGRVIALERMRVERAKRQEKIGVSKLEIQEAERSGKIVVEAKAIDFSWGEKPIVKGFSTIILRGDKVGIIGPNGSGKTTLLKILLGELDPLDGLVRHGSTIKIAYFDQLRMVLDEEKTLRDNLAGGNDRIVFGDRTQHVIGYLQDFLFSPDRIMSPVKTLSGGERNRLLLAKLFATPSNVLVLDEPTNDLDSETLDLLEDRLLEYKGTILVVSHDRDFLNNVVTSTIVFEGDGNLQEYVGGYDDWLSQKPQDEAKEKTTVEKPKFQKPRKEKTKLSYKEARELDALPQMIEALEKEKDELGRALNSPELYASRDLDKLYALNNRLKEVETELDRAYHRWDELETESTRLAQE